MSVDQDSPEQPQRVAVVRDGARLALTFDWPERRNALDFAAWDQLSAGTDLARDDDIRVVTLTGAGSAFCAGVEFAAIGESLRIERHRFPSFIRRWSEVADRFERLAQPTVAAINGPAIGAGFEIALACDVRIASNKAVFAMPQLQMGIVPDVGGTSRLGRAAGAAFAKDIILTGRVIGAEEALAHGIVSRVVPHDELPAVLDDIASTIAAIPWPAAYFADLAIDFGRDLDSRHAADFEAVADQVMLREEAVWDRVSAFMEQRGLKGLDPTSRSASD